MPLSLKVIKVGETHVVPLLCEQTPPIANAHCAQPGSAKHDLQQPSGVVSFYHHVHSSLGKL
ncbi:hypothetical protein RirG_244530 [Rhizophagus irregularis DAOM 197198w]|uniref:Uncharacterized protein n=1 Tax=Rhizophagus irregularis (strain DAOM 197198w) TaxID=1432141 RepID=A0A015LEV8_RHIIW|nr:hypothetical protein RirG_244530 [Rhizophagus irregularis DAOM 197198w]